MHGMSWSWSDRVTHRRDAPGWVSVFVDGKLVCSLALRPDGESWQCVGSPEIVEDAHAWGTPPRLIDDWLWRVSHYANTRPSPAASRPAAKARRVRKSRGVPA